MGIKFLCPNGHKLNVKSFLSGKRAICPKCGARVVVPTADETLTQKNTSETEEGWSEISIAEVEVTPAIATVSPAQGSTTINAPVATAVVDAIAESPAAVWYVRPATGGQYGPASGEIMRGWLGEGRVGASSLVWRAGWGEWRSAAAVFPQLGPAMPVNSTVTPTANGPPTPSASSLPQGKLVQSVPVSPPQMDVVDGVRPGELTAEDLGIGVSPLALGGRKRRQSNHKRLIASGLLFVVVVVLIVVLIIVASRQSTSEETPAKTTTPPAEDKTT